MKRNRSCCFQYMRIVPFGSSVYRNSPTIPCDALCNVVSKRGLLGSPARCIERCNSALAFSHANVRITHAQEDSIRNVTQEMPCPLKLTCKAPNNQEGHAHAFTDAPAVTAGKRSNCWSVYTNSCGNGQAGAPSSIRFSRSYGRTDCKARRSQSVCGRARVLRQKLSYKSQLELGTRSTRRNGVELGIKSVSAHLFKQKFIYPKTSV